MAQAIGVEYSCLAEPNKKSFATVSEGEDIVEEKNPRGICSFVGLCVGTASSAQFGFGGIVYDPTDDHNAVLRYIQLQQRRGQLRLTYAQLVRGYIFALRMAQNLRNMSARHRAQFSHWRNVVAPKT